MSDIGGQPGGALGLEIDVNTVLQLVIPTDHVQGVNADGGRSYTACVTNGWSVFPHSGWPIADIPDEALNLYLEVLERLEVLDTGSSNSQDGPARPAHSRKAVIIQYKAIEKFLHGAEFADLRKYSLNGEGWKALQIFHKILQISHAFQQMLSSQSTPTLINILPAFEAMKQCWEDRQTQLSHAADIIQQGLDKLADYRDHNQASDT
ncbi:uncharacterized protein PHACADRAFT_202026 [Phanerochaete carnosa HHB-10118-sp]|uniref:Uncharacterized protein n=1 Tax=Phanerochaete carnosa (strain HHB-10118-sp) TaxID=650164 RepID=K5VD75_PHACS|nr:uncharacterized protein PHACADRAFT_202026 [Phanerochaete carnosa HHB-10118-sp]EKM49088.1 hypothetical protein PHACADRAFT_202026 [Phanerochaete carnosa HHB-10118-sp]